MNRAAKQLTAAREIGIGPLNSVARNMTRRPRGIASFQGGGEADMVREFGNLEYEVEMNPFLDPVSRAGFDPDVVKVMKNVGSHYNPSTDKIIIGNRSGTASLNTQAHEFRHRGLNKLASDFYINIPTLKKEMPSEDFESLLNFFKTMKSQDFRKRGKNGFGKPGSEEYKFDRHEMFAEFFEKPYEYNLPAQHYAATGEDPASAQFQRVMNVNPKTKEPYTDAERDEYAARTGTVIKKMLTKDTVQQQMDRLETVGQDEFRTFAGSDPENRTGDEIFKQAMLVQEFAKKQNAAVKNYFEGGAVMNGIGTLNETARNMTRGPRGIGAYQQFAPGGEVLRPQSRPPEMRPQSRPPEMRPQPRPPEMQEMAEIRAYLDSLTDSTNPEVNQPPLTPNFRGERNEPDPDFRGMAGPNVTPARPEKYFEINSYDVNGETQEAIDFKDGMRMFMPDVGKMIHDSGYGNQPVVGKETAAEVLEFLQENNPTSQQFIDYFSSARLAMGGEVSGPPPMRGPDPQGIGAFQQYADGGPVYMSRGGEAEMSEYRKALIMSESSGRSNVVNEEGYMGSTQAGDEAIIDFKKATGLGFTDKQFLNDPDLQMRFQDWYEQTTINFVMDKGLDAYMGRVIKGVPITMSSLLGMAHIGGNNGMRDFLESGGRDDPNDGNTSLSDYGIKFANMAIYGDSGGAKINRATPEAIAESLSGFDDSLGYFRPQERPPEIEFSAPLTSLRPQARPDAEPTMRPQNRPLALPEGQSMIEKYGLPGDMPGGGIISAIR